MGGGFGGFSNFGSFGNYGNFGNFGMTMGYGSSGYAVKPNSNIVSAPAKTNTATLVVTLPKDAKLTIGGEKTTSTSAKRVFVSPSLKPGKEYQYTLKARVVRDGQIQVATAQVTVRANEVSRVELKIPDADVAAQ